MEVIVISTWNVLDMQFFVVDKLPEKSTLVPNHVGFGT